MDKLRNAFMMLELKVVESVVKAIIPNFENKAVKYIKQYFICFRWHGEQHSGAPGPSRVPTGCPDQEDQGLASGY